MQEQRAKTSTLTISLFIGRRSTWMEGYVINYKTVPLYAIIHASISCRHVTSFSSRVGDDLQRYFI